MNATDNTNTTMPPAVAGQLETLVRPRAYMTAESARRLASGGNAKGAVPVHRAQSAVAKIPLYDATELRRAMRQQAKSMQAASAAMREALLRLRRWGGVPPSGAYSATIVWQVCDWLDGGMNGDLPPLPEWARPNVRANRPVEAGGRNGSELSE